MNGESQGKKDEFELYRERVTNFSREFELGLFLHIGRKSLSWILLLLLLSGVGSYLYLRYTPATYESSVLIQLGEQDRAKKVLDVSQLYEKEGKLSSELEVLRSKFLMKRALKRLPLKVRYFAKGNLLTNEHYMRSPYLVDILALKDSSLIGDRIRIKALGPNKGRLVYKTGGGIVQKSFDASEPVSTPHFKIRFDRFHGSDILNSQEENNFFFRFTSPAGLARDLHKDLSVNISNAQAKTIKISYKGNNRVMTKDVAQALAEEYIAYDLEQKRKSSEQTLDFIHSQLDTVRKRLRRSETKLQSYRQEHDIKEEQGGVSDARAKRMADLEDRIVDLELRVNILQRVKEAMKKEVDDLEVDQLIPMVSGSALSSPSLRSMIDKLQKLLVKREESMFQMKEKSSRIASLNHQIRIQKRLVKESVSSLLDKARTKKRKLREKVKEMEQRYFGVPQKKIEYARLKRVFNINEKYYTLLLEKKTEYSISKAGFVHQNEILEEARVPESPISPNTQLAVITFLMFGVVISFLLVVVRYLIHDQITSLNEVVRMTQASVGVLGIIPRYKEKAPPSQLLVDKNPKSMITESFRGIRSNLQFLSDKEGSHLAAVTSTISGEGKTFFAINLAGIYALMGKKVLLLDLDMRKPKIHLEFQVNNEKGISTLLSGANSLEDVLCDSQMENLSFIPSGPVPPNPSELLLSDRMTDLLQELEQKYDVVITDTPPVGLVTDGLEIIKKADLPIYIFRAEFSKRQFIQNVDRLINENGIRKLSVVLNGVDPDRGIYGYNYGYGYGYGYGYSYGHNYYTDEGKRKRTSKNWFQRIFKR